MRGHWDQMRPYKTLEICDNLRAFAVATLIPDPGDTSVRCG